MTLEELVASLGPRESIEFYREPMGTISSAYRVTVSVGERHIARQIPKSVLATADWPVVEHEIGLLREALSIEKH